MINERIRDKEVRLIGQDGEQLGIMSARDAMKLAREADLDLVKIAPGAKPPVCKIIVTANIVMKWHARKKRPRRSRKTMEIKEVRLSPNIDVNDLTQSKSCKKVLRKRR